MCAVTATLRVGRVQNGIDMLEKPSKSNETTKMRIALAKGSGRAGVGCRGCTDFVARQGLSAAAGGLLNVFVVLFTILQNAKCSFCWFYAEGLWGVSRVRGLGLGG